MIFTAFLFFAYYFRIRFIIFFFFLKRSNRGQINIIGTFPRSFQGHEKRFHIMQFAVAVVCLSVLIQRPLQGMLQRMLQGVIKKYIYGEFARVCARESVARNTSGIKKYSGFLLSLWWPIYQFFRPCLVYGALYYFSMVADLVILLTSL